MAPNKSPQISYFTFKYVCYQIVHLLISKYYKISFAHFLNNAKLFPMHYYCIVHLIYRPLNLFKNFFKYFIFTSKLIIQIAYVTFWTKIDSQTPSPMSRYLFAAGKIPSQLFHFIHFTFDCVLWMLCFRPLQIQFRYALYRACPSLMIRLKIRNRLKL